VLPPPKPPQSPYSLDGVMPGCRRLGVDPSSPGRNTNHISPERDWRYLQRTLDVFQPISGRQLSEEDAREIAHNLLGYFRVLREWAQASQAATSNRSQSTDELGDDLSSEQGALDVENQR
jgi:hypothetical protein